MAPCCCGPRPIPAVGPAPQVLPTVGLNLAHFEALGTPLLCWDVGGAAGLRGIWSKYYRECHALVFVVDASDRTRLDEAKLALDRALGALRCLLRRAGLRLRGAMPSLHPGRLGGRGIDACAGHAAAHAACLPPASALHCRHLRPHPYPPGDRDLYGTPLLVLANKQDCEGAATPAGGRRWWFHAAAATQPHTPGRLVSHADCLSRGVLSLPLHTHHTHAEVADALGLGKLPDASRAVNVLAVTAKTGEGVKPAMQWLVEAVRKSQRPELIRRKMVGL